jgi:predicted SnoaL-like aldol condensation-catalyzing enzyme
MTVKMNNSILITAALALSLPGIVNAGTVSAKDTAIQAMVDVFSNQQPDAVDRHFAPGYKQHNLAIADGVQGLKSVAAQMARVPDANTTIYRAIADQDLVVLHSVYDGIPLMKGKPAVVFDLFRLENGKIAEHWGALAPLGPANSFGHTLIDGPAVITDRDRTEANRAVVKKFIDTVLIGGQVDRVGEFLDVSHYTQHSAQSGDGIDGSTAMAGVTSAAMQPGFKPHRILAEGNFVFVQAEGGAGSIAIYELYRLEKGKLVEHWEVMAPVPPRDQWKNPNGPF